MSKLDEGRAIIKGDITVGENFWNEYLKLEMEAYRQILVSGSNKVTGTISELSEKYEMDLKVLMLFLDGMKSSLMEELDIDSLTEESSLELRLDFEKLFYNMLGAKANWLYTLEEWDNILSLEKRSIIKKTFNKDTQVINENKIGRNDPCECGSGKKYKKCCMERE